MACFHPLSAYLSRTRDEFGKRSLFFVEKGDTDFINLPCGKCVGCKTDRAKSWAVRIMHERQMHQDAVFLTLTYSDEALAARCAVDEDFNPTSLQPLDLRLFWKRLREEFAYKYSVLPRKIFKGKNHERWMRDRIRYFAVGEYGEDRGRPHYHAIVFGCDFSDKYFWRMRGEHRCYRSPTLEKIWTYGHSEIGSVTMQSAMYLALYTLDKTQNDSYFAVDGRSGEYKPREPEFCVMSRRPGLGTEWIKKYFGDVYPYDFVVSANGSKVKTPRFYDNYFKELDAFGFEDQVQKRLMLAANRKEEYSPERLAARERVRLAAIKNRKREL